MNIALRPHHFLCIKGYKGQNYDQAQTANWQHTAELLKQNPKADVFIMSGKDDLCTSCPGSTGSHKIFCRENIVNSLDNKVAALLGLKIGSTYKYQEILEKLNEIMSAQKHKELCEECAWWNKGLCKDSFEKRN